MKKLFRQAKGFSLIEMMVVLMIIGVILSIAMPAFGPTTKTFKLKSSADNLANILESARQYANTNNVDCYVLFPMSTGDSRDGTACKVYWKPKGATTGGGTVGKWEYFFKGVTVNSSSVLDSGTFPFPNDVSGSRPTLDCVKFLSGGRAENHCTIRLTEAQSGDDCYLRAYNYASSVKMWDIGEDPPSIDEE